MLALLAKIPKEAETNIANPTKIKIKVTIKKNLSILFSFIFYLLIIAKITPTIEKAIDKIQKRIVTL